MNLILYVSLLITWLISFILLLPKVQKVNNQYQNKQRNRLMNLLGYEKVQKEAANDGYTISIKEFSFITIFALASGFIIAVVLGNYYFIAVGVAISYMLPRYIILKMKRSKREEKMFELPDNLKTLTSKLSDFSSVQRALEVAIPDMHGITKSTFEDILVDLQTGFPLDTALDTAQKDIKIKRYSEYCKKLLSAQEQGFHDQAIRSLKETTREFSTDNLIVKDLFIKSKKDRKSLKIVMIMCWLIPIALSTINFTNSNIFLETTLGKIYVVIFVILTVFVFVKADEWLAVNLDNL
ncbi:type II secretion system F family protein [Paenibacillus enshidis]|uniref:Type II secretion system F family protein n=1 Tax=Paenibacillus enshidis TaxID=1458439 RepID=A0ABV5AVV6_9BACL